MKGIYQAFYFTNDIQELLYFIDNLHESSYQKTFLKSKRIKPITGTNFVL